MREGDEMGQLGNRVGIEGQISRVIEIARNGKEVAYYENGVRLAKITAWSYAKLQPSIAKLRTDHPGADIVDHYASKIIWS
jgi:hypothetical protein